MLPHISQIFDFGSVKAQRQHCLQYAALLISPGAHHMGGIFFEQHHVCRVVRHNTGDVVENAVEQRLQVKRTVQVGGCAGKRLGKALLTAQLLLSRLPRGNFLFQRSGALLDFALQFGVQPPYLFAGKHPFADVVNDRYHVGYAAVCAA